MWSIHSSCVCVGRVGAGVLVVGPRGTGKTLLVQVPPAPLSTVPPATLPCLLTAHAVCLSMPLSVQLHGRATLGHVHVA